jgi:hypothetical protein
MLEAVASKTRNRTVQGGVHYCHHLAGIKGEHLRSHLFRSAEVKTTFCQVCNFYHFFKKPNKMLNFHIKKF